MIRSNMLAYRKNEDGLRLRERHIQALRAFGYFAKPATTKSIALAIATDAPFEMVERLRMK